MFITTLKGKGERRWEWPSVVFQEPDKGFPDKCQSTGSVFCPTLSQMVRFYNKAGIAKFKLFIFFTLAEMPSCAWGKDCLQTFAAM